MDILVRCPVFPTEDENRVRSALTNLFATETPEFDTHDEQMLLIMSNKRSSLDIVRQSIHSLRIIDAARRKLTQNWNGFGTSIFFDKQAAYYGTLRLVDELEESPPLGCIELEIMTDDDAEFEDLLAWFTPPTKDGRIVKS
ncbi:MAG: RNA-binding domain-containing protein [Candidatus Thorarchaeota archaeon]